MEKKRKTPLARHAPVLCLLVMAPWVGEFLLGNSPLSHLPGLPLLIPLYGGGALLIREAAVRTGHGWPAVLLFGAAYGIIEAGLVDQSIFNLHFENVDQRAHMILPVLEIDAYNAQAFVIGHAVWSIAVPIALTGMLWPHRRSTPWLSRAGLAICAAMYAAGCWIVFRLIYETEQFLASPRQLAGAAAAALILIIAALLTKKRHRAAGPARRRVPRPRLLGFGSFAAAGLFIMRPESWGGVLFGFALIGMTAALVWRWSRQPDWDLRHEFALTAGAALTYAWLGFALTLLIRPDDTLAWVGNVIFAMVAIGLLLLAYRRIRHFRPEKKMSVQPAEAS